jgi:[acyl-carrier-protein] S-malonyltransferase
VRVAAVFPGQGSHRAGSLDPWIGHPAFRVVDEIDAGLGREILPVTRDETAGGRTADAQPAIFAASMVAWRALLDAGVRVDVVAGHSLGEVTAAVAAGCWSPTDGAALVGARGDAMAAACAASPGTMAALVKLDPDNVDALVAAVEGAVVANDNAPGQVVVAGPPDAIEAIRDRAREAGGRALPLDVEGAFHSPAMAPALAPVTEALARHAPADPRPALVTGTTGKLLQDGAAVARAIGDGILAPVRWRAVQATLLRLGVTDVVELGPGAVLAGMAKRSLPDVRVHTVAGPDDLADVTLALSVEPDDSLHEVAR